VNRDQLAKTVERLTELSDKELHRGFRKACAAFRDYTEKFDMEMAETSLYLIDALLDEWNGRAR
jgi:hypothetical protein